MPIKIILKVRKIARNNIILKVKNCTVSLREGIRNNMLGKRSRMIKDILLEVLSVSSLNSPLLELLEHCF